MGQDLFDQIYGFLRTGILCVDSEGKLRYLNKFATAALGVPATELLGKKFSELFAVENTATREIWRFLPREGFFDFSCPTGEGRAAGDLPAASRLSFAGCEGWSVMRFGVAERVPRELNNLFADLGLLLMHESGVLQICGDVSAEELLGHPIAGSFRDSLSHRKEVHLNGRDYLLTSYPITMSGQSAMVLIAYLDVTDLNKTQRKLIQAMHDAEAANKAKSFFLANMSHELRTPLNAVIGYCELLQDGGLSQKEVDEYLRCINLSGNALLRLINNILDLSKIEAEQMVFTPNPTDIFSLIMELKTVFKQSCEKNGIEQLIDIEPDLPLLMIDELRLRQVMLNLIGNACKFTHDGYLKIIVRYVPDGGAVDRGTLNIAVEDSGRGIARDKHEAVFKPFTQQDAMKDPHVFKGTGLGLAISNEMVQHMGGRIELQSELGKGSIFTVVLEQVAPVRKMVAPTVVQANPLPQEYLEELDLILVDDVPVNVKMLSAMCGTFGIRNRSAGSGAEALKLMREAPPNMILTDMWMPEMSGLELFEEIRKEEKFKHIPIVIVTADVEAKEKGDLMKFDAVILKPVSKEKLRNFFIEQYNRRKSGS